jgi:hypothetical protein
MIIYIHTYIHANTTQERLYSLISSPLSNNIPFHTYAYVNMIDTRYIHTHIYTYIHANTTQERLYSIISSPLSDNMILCGGRGLSVLTPPSCAKEQFRLRLGDFIFHLTERMYARTPPDLTIQHDNFAGKNGGSAVAGDSVKQTRRYPGAADALFGANSDYHHTLDGGNVFMAGGSAGAARAHDSEVVLEPLEVQDGFKKGALQEFVITLEERILVGLELMRIKRYAAARAEALCGIACVGKLRHHISRGNFAADIGHDTADAMMQIDKLYVRLSELGASCTNTRRAGSGAVLTRTYQLDEEMRSALRALRERYAEILAGESAKGWRGILRDKYVQLCSDFEDIVRVDKDNGMWERTGVWTSPLGKRMWRVNGGESAAFLHKPNMQAILCGAITAYDSFLTGTEDGSVFFWERDALVGAVPLHQGPLLDLTIWQRQRMSESESESDFSFPGGSSGTDRRASNTDVILITVGADQYVRLSVCMGTQLVKLRELRVPGDVECVSVSNLFGVDKSDGHDFVDWRAREEARRAYMSMNHGNNDDDNNNNNRKKSGSESDNVNIISVYSVHEGVKFVPVSTNGGSMARMVDSNGGKIIVGGDNGGRLKRHVVLEDERESKSEAEFEAVCMCVYVCMYGHACVLIIIIISALYIQNNETVCM